MSVAVDFSRRLPQHVFDQAAAFLLEKLGEEPALSDEEWDEVILRLNVGEVPEATRRRMGWWMQPA